MGLGIPVSAHRGSLVALGLVAILVLQSPTVHGAADPHPEDVKDAIKLLIDQVIGGGSPHEPREFKQEYIPTACLALTHPLIEFEVEVALKQFIADNKVTWEDVMRVLSSCCPDNTCTIKGMKGLANDIEKEKETGTTKVWNTTTTTISAPVSNRNGAVTLDLGFFLLTWIFCLLI